MARCSPAAEGFFLHFTQRGELGCHGYILKHLWISAELRSGARCKVVVVVVVVVVAIVVIVVIVSVGVALIVIIVVVAVAVVVTVAE